MIYEILPTQIFVKKVENPVVDKEVERSLSNVNFDYQPEWGTTVKLSNVRDWTACIMESFDMDSLQDEIKKNVQEYAGRQLDYVCTSWLARYDKGDYAQIHSHYPATYSGCYFYDAGSEDSCHFFFDNDYNRCQLDVKSGYMIIFPSYLKHGVTTNQSDNSKITLAFNLAVY